MLTKIDGKIYTQKSGMWRETFTWWFKWHTQSSHFFSRCLEKYVQWGVFPYKTTIRIIAKSFWYPLLMLMLAHIASTATAAGTGTDALVLLLLPLLLVWYCWCYTIAVAGTSISLLMLLLLLLIWIHNSFVWRGWWW